MFIKYVVLDLMLNVTYKYDQTIRIIYFYS